MKKLSFFLMAMLVSMTSFAAALGEGYSKVTDITTLSAGDKVVLYCDDAEKGVTGWDGNKTATAAADGWVEYVVEAADGGVLLKDGEQYIALTAKNGFYYNATGSVCKVNAEGVLYITWSGADYLLYENANNGSPLYRMYVDKTGNAQYKPVYVYEVVAAEETPEVTVPTNAELWEAFKPYYNTYYGLARADQPIDKVSTFAAAKMQQIMTDAASEYKWLGDYVLGVAAGQGVNLPTDMAAANEGAWRWAVHAFFNATTGANGAAGTDFTEAGKPENWGPAYLAAQEGTTPEPEPTTETVYFVNAANWTTVNVYAWTTDPNASWPGVAAVKEAEQIAGYDVYSYTVEAGTYANVIFNNGSGQQTADLVWTAGKYYVKDGWYTKEEAEAKLAKPVEYESVYFVDNQGWGKANIYTWTPEVGTWPGVAMTKEAEQLAGFDVYSYTVEKGTTFGGIIFNNGSKQTADLKWTAGKYYVQNAWYTKEEAEAKLAGPVTPPVITYVLMGVAGDWTTGIALTQNADNANEYVLLGQDIAEGDAVKVVTLTDGVATAWCGNVDEYSVAHSADDMGNIVLAPGKYDFYYKVAEDLIYIAAVAPAVEPCTEAIAVNWNEPIALQANADVWYHLNLATAVEGGNDISVLLVNTSDEETEITVAAYENCPELDIITEVTKTLKPNEKLDGIAEYAEYLDGQVSEMYIHVTTKGGAVEVSAETVKPEIEWIPMDLEITNLTTEVMEVEGAKYLLLQGRDDMNDADVMLFLNNYADVDDDYEVNAENSYMTFGGIELTVLEGVIAQVSETDKGTIYQGTVRTYAAEEDMYVEFALLMYAAPATPLVITDATVEVNEDLGTLTFKTAECFVELSGYTAPGVHEGPQICLLETPEAVAFANYVETVVADGIITLTGEFTSFMGAKFALTISGKLPQTEPVEKPEPTYTENKLNTYAFGRESELTEEALNVTYRLNNSNATSVNVLVYKGEEVVATVAGTTTIGVNTVSIPVAELPQGRMLTWSVEVNGTSVAAPTQEEKIYSFYHPSGVDIDVNPENETFGLLLVNEGMHKVKDVSGYVSSGFGAGIFAFAPSFDLIPNGELPGNNGGIEFTNGRYDAAGSTAYSPRRIRISEDGRIFVTSLNTDGNYLWEVDPNNFNEWTPIFKGTRNEQAELITEDSAFIAAPNAGFDVKGAGENLQLVMYSANIAGIGTAMGGFRLDEYNLGTATEWTTTPSKNWVTGLYAINYTGTQVEYDNEGGLWIASYRGTASDANPGLVHINAEGVEDAKLIWNNVRQAGIRFNNDFTKLVVAGNNGAAKKATIYSISKDANGAPVLTEETVVDMSAVGNNLNDFAWDYAGNLYACGNSAEKLIGWAMPYSGQVVTPAASKYAFHIGELIPEPTVVTEMVGVVKRAVQNGESTIVLTHEADGTAHIYEVANGTILELVQHGVIAVDPENAGDLLAISDIAVTEDGKLIAINKIVCQAGDAQVDEGYKRGETRVYIWNDLAGAPSVWFTSKMSSNWYRSVQGHTMAYKGTSTNGTLFTTGVTATGVKFRYSVYNVIDGVYTDPAVNDSEHYHFTKGDAQTTDLLGANYEINMSLLAENTWVLDGELVDPFEITDPLTYNAQVTAGTTITEDLGKKYNGASYVTVEDQVLMVAPFANPDGQLVGAEILNITNGFDAPQYVDMVYVDEAVAVEAAATAVQVVEGGLNITLVADNAIHTWFVELNAGGDWEVYEDEITNLVIDLDNLVLIGGPSSAFQVDVYLGLGDYNRNDDTYQLLPESSIAVMGSDATFIEGYAYEVDAFTPSAKAVVRCEWNGMKLEFHLTMTAAPLEATVVVVENATVEIEKYLLWGDMYDYALKMTGEWVNEADGLTYPVLVEIPVYYPEATEPSEIMSTVTVGGWGDNDPWLGFGEGTLTVTTVDGVVTATGIVQNPMAGVAIDITISGKLPQDPGPGTGIEDVELEVKAVKVIKNGQLIISKDGKEYNAQGAIVK